MCAPHSPSQVSSPPTSCSREHLSALSRLELEGRLESTLIIIEALSCQLRDWQQSQWPVPRLGPADQRDVLTQTDIIHPEAVRGAHWRGGSRASGVAAGCPQAEHKGACGHDLCPPPLWLSSSNFLSPLLVHCTLDRGARDCSQAKANAKAVPGTMRGRVACHLGDPASIPG